MSLASNLKNRIKNAVTKLRNTLNPVGNAGASGVAQTTATGLPASSRTTRGGTTLSSAPPTKVTIPTSPSGPMSVDPNSNKAKIEAAARSSSLASPNYNYGLPDQSLEQIIRNATGGKSGGMSYAPGTPGGMSMPLGSITTPTGKKSGGSSSGTSSRSTSYTPSYASIASSDYSYGLGDISSSSTSASDSGSSSGGGSGGRTGGKTGTQSSGGGGASGVNTISDQLSAIEREALRIQKEVEKLAEQEQSAASDAVTSDTEEVNYEKEALARLKENGMLPDDGALDLLDKELRDLRDRQRENEANINAGYNVQQQGLIGQQANETGQLSAGLAAAGGYLGFSGSGTGVMLKLAEAHRAELVSLESERQNALNEARNAAAERRFDIVRLKADEIARIDQEKYERVQEYNAEVKKQVASDLERAKTLKVEEDIMNAIMSGNTTVEDIYKALDGGATIEEIKTTLDRVTKKSAIEGGFKISSANVAKFLGAGMTADDINAMQEYVNENGYDDELRSSLTPAQRAVADKVFNLTGTSGGSTAIMGLTDLARVEEQYGVTFPYGVTKGEVEQFIQDNWGMPESELQDAIDEYFGKQPTKTTSASSNITEEYLRANYTTAELQNLSARTGAASFWTGGAADATRMFSDPVYMSKLKKLVDTLVNQEGYSFEEALTALTK